MSTSEADPFPEPPPFVVGDKAEGWFYKRRGGGIVLDRHLELVHQIFGAEVSYRVTASVNRWNGRPSHFFIEIDLPVDDEASQDRLIELERALVEIEDELVERSNRRRPYGDISVVLAGNPVRWDAVGSSLDVEDDS